MLPAILAMLGLAGASAKQGYDERKAEQAEFKMRQDKQNQAIQMENQKYFTELFKGDLDPDSAMMLGQSAVKRGMDPNLVAPMVGQSTQRWAEQQEWKNLIRGYLQSQGAMPGGAPGVAPSPTTSTMAMPSPATPSEGPPTVPIDTAAMYRRMHGIDDRITELREGYRDVEVENFQTPIGAPPEGSPIDPLMHEQSMMMGELESQRARFGGAEQPTTPLSQTTPQMPPAQPSVAPQTTSAVTPTPQPQDLTIPRPRAGMKPSISLSESGASVTLTPTGPLGGKEITADLISQARAQNMPVYKINAALDAENARRRMTGEPPLEPDRQALEQYEDLRFETVRKQIEDDLRSRMDAGSAFVAATQAAYDQTGHLPQRWQSVIQPKEGDLAASAYTKAVAQASEALPKVLATAGEAKTPTAMRGAIPPGFLSRAIDQTPHLRPEDSIRAKHVAAETLTQRIMPQLQQAFPGRTQAQYAALAMQLGAYAVDGEVPREWHDAVMGQPQAFGFSPAQAEMIQALGISPFDPDAGGRAQDAITQQAFQRQFQEKALGTAQDIQAVEETAQRLQPGVATPPKAPVKSPAEIQAGQESRALTQKGKVETQHKEIEHQFSKAPTGAVEKIQPVDDLYVTGLSILKHATTKGKDGQSLLDKYGDQPAFYFATKQAFQKQFGAVPADVAKYIALLGKIFNVEKKTFAGTATSLNERSDLLTFMPDPKENLRTALQKVQTLISAAGTELERDLGFLEKNYPKSDFSSFGYRKIQKARQAQQEAQGKEKP